MIHKVSWRCARCGHMRADHHINMESCDLAIFAPNADGKIVPVKCDCDGWVGEMLEDDLGPRAA